MKCFLGCVAIAALSACAALPVGSELRTKSTSDVVVFTVVGDLPYNDTQAYSLREFITPKIKNSDFTIHIGDFKPGSGVPCTVELDKSHMEWMRSLGHPVFYTPGDNDWADCNRPQNSPVVRQTKRLKDLRERFFSRPIAGIPNGWRVVSQGDLPENQSWAYRGVRFATLHLIGGNNGRDTAVECGFSGECDTREDFVRLIRERDLANSKWVEVLFDKAEHEGADAVIIATHADVFDVENRGVRCVGYKDSGCDGFREIRRLIVDRSAEYGGPVLLVHGDTSPYCLSNKFGGRAAPNLWRLNAAGDYVLIDAVKVRVRPNSAAPFEVKGVLSNLVPASEGCD